MRKVYLPRRALINADAVFDMSPEPGGPVAFPALSAAAKMRVEISSTHLVVFYISVDTLVAYLQSLVIPKPVTYLLRAPVFS